MTQNNRWPCIWIGYSSTSVTAVNHFPLVLLLPFYLSTFLIIQNSHLERPVVPGGRERKDPHSHKVQGNTTALSHQEASLFIRQFSCYQCLYLLFYIGPYFPLNCLCPPETRYVSWVQALIVHQNSFFFCGGLTDFWRRSECEWNIKSVCWKIH